MTLAFEHSFYSGRSLWQMILGGVFERFPDLRVAFVETEADWIGPAIAKLDRRLDWGDDWTGWAQLLQRTRAFSRRARDYWADNCYSGISPFTDSQIPLEEVARPSAEYETFGIGCDNAMFGVDYPHFESVFPDTATQVDALVAHPAITNEVANKILCENAAHLYGFDLAGLQPDISRVGFDMEGKAVRRPG
jgi:predicted TIM-barrel fold metal-dependent hydrolase